MLSKEVEALWAGTEAHLSPTPHELSTRIRETYLEDGIVSFLARVDAELLHIEEEGAGLPMDDKCLICLEDVAQTKVPEEEWAGKKNRNKRLRYHRMLKNTSRLHMSSHGFDTLEVIPLCGHFMHSHCLRQLRTVKEGGESVTVTCVKCRKPAPFTVRTDVVIPSHLCILYHQLTSIMRSFKPCKYVVEGVECNYQKKCRFSHVVEGVLVQQGEPRPKTWEGASRHRHWLEDVEYRNYTGAETSPHVRVLPERYSDSEEDWTEEIPSPLQNLAASSSSSSSPRFVRPPPRRSRPPGTRGTGRIPVLERATGRVLYLDEIIVIMDEVSQNRQYDRNVPSQSR